MICDTLYDGHVFKGKRTTVPLYGLANVLLCMFSQSVRNETMKICFIFFLTLCFACTVPKWETELST